MARANTIQTNFTAGEVSPHMRGRVDVNKYFNGARKLRNMVVAPQGGVFRRPGTKFTAEVKTSSKVTVLRPFKFSEVQPYVLEFGDLYVRFYFQQARVENPPGTPVEVTTPYVEADLPLLKITQSADVLYITHPNYAPRTLSRVSANSWVLALHETIDGPYLSVEQPTQVTLTTLNDSTVLRALNGTPFVAYALKTITNVVASPGGLVRVTATGHGYSTGNSIGIAQVLGAIEANGEHTITVVDANTFDLDIYKHASTTYISGGTASVMPNPTHGVEYRINDEWRKARIVQIYSTTEMLINETDRHTIAVDESIKVTAVPSGGFFQLTSSGPLFTAGSVGRAVRATTTAGVGSWYNVTSFGNSESVIGDKVLTVVTTWPTTKIELVEGSHKVYAILTDASASWLSSDVDRKVRLQFATAEWVYGKVDHYVSTSIVVVSLNKDLPLDTIQPLVGAGFNGSNTSNQGRTTKWFKGAWSVATKYPSAVTFHQDRLCFASSVEEPTTIWMSESGDYVGFATSDPLDSSVTDAHAITITLVSREVNAVKWMSSGPVLLVGTQGAEWQIKPSSITQTLTPTNVSATPQTAFGSINEAEGHRLGSQVLFVQRGARKLRELVYDFNVDAFVARDLSIISEHIPRDAGGMEQSALQTNPFNVLWVVLADGKLLGVTYEKEHEVTGWHLHDVGGFVESIAVIESQSGQHDDVYLVVRRTVNAAIKRYVERIERFAEPTTITDLSAYYYLDCGVEFDNVTPGNFTDVTGLSHLSGETIAMVVDGIYVGTRLVTAGVATVGYLATVVHVGIANEAVVGLLDAEGGSEAGSSQGKAKRIHDATARVDKSLHFMTAVASPVTDARMTVSASQDPGIGDRSRIIPHPVVNPPSAVTFPAPTNEGVELITGDISFGIDGTYWDGARFEIIQPDPYPLNVLAIFPKLTTYE